MRTTSPVLPGLLKSLASNGVGEDSDALLTIRSQGLLVFTVPLPLIIGSAFNNKDIRDSQILLSEGIFTTDLTSKLCTLLEGVWDIELQHMTVPVAGGDFTAFSRVQLSQTVISPAVTTTVVLSELVAINGISQIVSRKFRLTVNALSPITFSHIVDNGVGTSTIKNRVSLICTRIL